MVDGPVPSVGGAKRSFNVSSSDMSTVMFDANSDTPIAASPISPSKKAKLCHSINTLTYPKNNEGLLESSVAQDGRPSPTDVRTENFGWGSQNVDAPSSNNCSQIKILPPTLRGITDAAAVLQASKSSAVITNAVGVVGKDSHLQDQQDQDTKPKNIRQDNIASAARKKSQPMLVSFPTESVYMLACCVKSASSRSMRKLLSRSDSQVSYSSSCSSNNEAVAVDNSSSPAVQNQGGIKEFIHPSNASLEWMIKCNDDKAGGGKDPLLFVMDGHHALNYCHFTKPKTFAIRPTTSITNSSSYIDAAPTTPSSTPIVKSSAPSVNSITPTLHGYQAPLTPKPATAGQIMMSIPSTPVTPNTHKLCAANFSESREAFLRLTSKFWPGPMVFHVQVRTLGGEDIISPSSMMTKKLSTSSAVSLPSLLSMEDLVAAGNVSPTMNNAATVPILPESVLVRASRLLPTRRDGQGESDDRHFVGMRCPSHPLPRKILTEVYHSPARLNTFSSTVSHSPSTESLLSMTSMDDGSSNTKSNRARSSIAVVGRMVSGNNKSATSSNASTGVISASDVYDAMSSRIQPTSSSADEQEDNGKLFIVDGEDNHERFSVPTCQYGKPHPVSLIIDGDNKTIHLIHHDSSDKEAFITRDSIYRALVKPANNTGQSFMSKDTTIKEKKGDTTSIDRVITAVLSRWKIEESTIS